MLKDFEKREKLINLFIERNNKINLSAIRDPQNIYIKHILDSLTLNDIFRFHKDSRVIDIGTWWGFPLLPLSITNPWVAFTWLDSVNKKLKAIENIASSLDLQNIEFVWARAEQHKQQYDYLTARAVGYIDVLFKISYHLVKKWWYFIFYKMFSEEEDKAITKLCRQKKIIIKKTHKYKLFEDDIQRIIYILKK